MRGELSMKKLIICFILIVSMLPAAAFAADAQSVTTIRAAYFHILYNGTEQAFTDVNGAEASLWFMRERLICLSERFPILPD